MGSREGNHKCSLIYTLSVKETAKRETRLQPFFFLWMQPDSVHQGCLNMLFPSIVKGLNLTVQGSNYCKIINFLRGDMTSQQRY